MFKKYIVAAYNGIKGGRSRSLLAVAGIAAGIFLVITLLAAARGVKVQIQEQITTLGSDVIAVNSVDSDTKSSGELTIGGLATPTLTLDDLAAVAKVPTVVAAAPIRYLGGDVTYKGFSTSPTFIAATTYNYPESRDFKLKSGRFFTKQEQNNRELSVVIGTSTQKVLFPNQNPLGKVILYENKKLKVVGIAEKTSSASDSVGSNNLDNAIYGPPALLGQASDQSVTYSMITAKVNDVVNVTSAESEITRNLSAYRSSDTFDVVTESSRVNTSQTILDVLTAFVAVIGVVSLGISGIGIMNMMIVTVTDRTKEIGVRKTVGATSFNIFIQFLLEALLLTLLGGVVGIVLSAAILTLIGRIAPIAPIFSTDLLVMGLGLSLSVGIVFGVGPAISAARKEPIDALQTERS